MPLNESFWNDEQEIRLRLGDCFEIMKQLPDSSIGAVITDPPYGLEFMNKDWDAPWKSGAGMSMPGIGERATPWPSYGGNLPFGGANPTCEECGGRLRGARKCECLTPTWMIDGEVVEDGDDKGRQEGLKQKQLFQAWSEGWLTECYRILRPGGIIKVFGAGRMFHRMAAAMENAGFVLPPEHSLEAWGYGSGFPKYLNTAKAIDAHFGKKPTVVGQSPNWRESKRDREAFGSMEVRGDNAGKLTVPTTPEAANFDGYATALKPGWEPFIVGTKPQ